MQVVRFKWHDGRYYKAVRALHPEPEMFGFWCYAPESGVSAYNAKDLGADPLRFITALGLFSHGRAPGIQQGDPMGVDAVHRFNQPEMWWFFSVSEDV